MCWIFVCRSHCSLPFTVHIYEQIMFFIIWYCAYLDTNFVLNYLIWCMFRHRFCCSLSDMVHVWTKILLLIIWYGAVLIQIMLFITWTEVLLFIICHAAYLGRGSVHYLIWLMVGQKFSFSLSDMEHVWTHSGVIISHILHLGSSDIYSHFCQIRTILLICPVIFSVALVNTGRRYIKFATGWTTKGLIPDKGDIFLFSKMTIPALRPDQPWTQNLVILFLGSPNFSSIHVHRNKQSHDNCHHSWCQYIITIIFIIDFLFIYKNIWQNIWFTQWT